MGDIATNAELKGLRSNLERVEQELKNAQQRLVDVKSEVGQLNEKLKGIRETIKRKESELQSDVSITEHALLRYLERVKHIDLEETKREILADSEDRIKTFPNCKIKRDGYRLIVKNRKILTVEET